MVEHWQRDIDQINLVPRHVGRYVRQAAKDHVLELGVGTRIIAVIEESLDPRHQAALLMNATCQLETQVVGADDDRATDTATAAQHIEIGAHQRMPHE